MASKVITRAIASLQKKAAVQARWIETCAAENAQSLRRGKLMTFVDRYLKLRDELAKESAEWN